MLAVAQINNTAAELDNALALELAQDLTALAPTVLKLDNANLSPLSNSKLIRFELKFTSRLIQ